MTSPSLAVLVVDDQPAVRKALEVLFGLHGIDCIVASSPDEAIALAEVRRVGVVLQDMNFGPGETSGSDGIDLFHRLREIQPDLPVLLMTAWASLETAVDLVRQGAADYIEKPWSDEKLIATVRRLLRMRVLEVENQRLRQELRASRDTLAEQYDLAGLVYSSEAMHRVVQLAVSVAGSEAPVLITGPNGSGKELVAEIVQMNSRRRKAPFVRVNVGAIPDELMESELFGAEPGAYTGLQERRVGHFESAHGGTLFLDEIDALSLSGQVKLLRVLQSGEFQRLGRSTTHRVDVRVISATNADLRGAIAEGAFREDLFFRLNVVELKIPALRDRREDILLLAEHFLSGFAKSEGRAFRLTDGARHELLRHDWPGNIRELQNRVQRAVVVAATAEISDEDLGLSERNDTAGGNPSQNTSPDEGRERDELLRAIARAEGVVAHAAEELGISRQSLYRKMSRLGIELERRPKG